MYSSVVNEYEINSFSVKRCVVGKATVHRAFSEKKYKGEEEGKKTDIRY